MSPVQRYTSPADIPASLPVFPLRAVILLPRATLPLNVFEPRYLQMVDDCLRSDRLIGIIQPDGDPQGRESPPGRSVPLRAVGCVGRITAFQELDDGRLTITLTGIARFRVAEELASARAYRIVRPDCKPFANDLEKGHGEDAVDRATLLAVLKSYLDANALKADWPAIERSGNEFLVNMLSVISPYGPQEKQALLEAADLKVRAEVLVALAEMEIASRTGGSGSTLQ